MHFLIPSISPRHGHTLTQSSARHPCKYSIHAAFSAFDLILLSSKHNTGPYSGGDFFRSYLLYCNNFCLCFLALVVGVFVMLVYVGRRAPAVVYYLCITIISPDIYIHWRCTIY